MAKPIMTGATFPVSPQTLYRTFMESRLHAAAIGSTARIAAKPGGTFAVFDGSIHGKTLLLVPGKLVVQTWRGTHWRKSDPDSILVARFSGRAGAGRIDLVHEGVPDHDHQGVATGWRDYYWKPWKVYFAAMRRQR